MKNNIFVGLVLLFGIFFDWSYAFGAEPIGFLDGANCSGFSGWACDADNYSKAIDVHFYADGTPSVGVFLGATTANTAREAAVGNQCGGNVNHGFLFGAPESIKDGKIHTINAYAINTPSGNNPLLSKSGKSINCCVGDQMAIRFVGTCAAVANCASAYGRHFSSILVNNDLLVDHSTDGYQYMQSLGIDINSINYILITHNHGDHFNAINVASLAAARTSATKLTLFGGPATIDAMKSYLNGSGKPNLINMVALAAYTPAAVGLYTVTPLIANHPSVYDSTPYIYIIQYRGKQFLYGTDSNVLSGTSLQKIYAAKLDLVIREMTFANGDDAGGHMDTDRVAAERADWIAHGVITGTTQYALTHISYCKAGSCSNPAGTVDPGDGGRLNICLPALTCTNDCVSGTKQCFGNGVQTCGNYDADSCLEWSVAAVCGNNQICSAGQCAAICTAKTCAGLGLDCGSVADGCGGTLSCGACTTGKTCTDNKCVSNCVPQTCTTLGNYDCGNWSGGCGTMLNCGACAAGKACSNGKCVTNCVSHLYKKCESGKLYWFNSCNTKEELFQDCASDAITSNYRCSGNWTQKETIKRGCLDGACTSESVWTNDVVCGTNKTCVNGICSATTCVPKTCSYLDYECGSVSDGCGKTLNCGTCASGDICMKGTCESGSTSTEPTAQMTRVEVLAKINQIVALIAQLQEQLKAMTGNIGAAKYSCTQITRNLYYGMKNDPQVKCLQEVLKAQGFAVVPTGDFGGITRIAVAQFQQKYASEILVPYGLKSGSGNVGNATMAKINALMTK